MNQPLDQKNKRLISFLLSGMEKGDLRGDLEIMPAIFNNSVGNAFKGEK